MTFAHEAVAALPSGANADASLIRAMCERRFAYVLDTSESAASFVAVDPVSGVLPLYMIQSGILFQYDSTDSTTVADGVTCLVTSDGKRYKTNGVAAPYSALSISIVAQPVSPSVGDAYVIPTAATGATWSGQDGKVGIYTARGWQFAVSPIGREIYVRDVDAFYHRNLSGTWIAGVGSIVLTANSVNLTNVLGAKASFTVKVENQTTNTPPASPTPPTAYIIGSSPTGSWAGQASKLAICLVAGTFTIVTPDIGDTVYDKSLGNSFRFTSGGWASSAGLWLRKATSGLAGSGGTSTGGSGTYDYNSGVAPTTTTLAVIDSSAQLIYAATSATSTLRLHYRADVQGSLAGTYSLGLFVDSNTSAIDWAIVPLFAANAHLENFFEFSAGDTLSHTYRIRILRPTGGADPGLFRRQMTIEESA